MQRDIQIGVTLWGPRACFTPPYAKVERLSLPVITPSAARGALNAIYGKPAEFWWEINEIRVMKPVKYASCMRNELKCNTQGRRSIDINEMRTQRHMTMLEDVRYQIIATLHPRSQDPHVKTAINAQALRRIETGACFNQPYLGIRECECYFELADYDEKPIDVTQDFGLMTYDTHVPYANTPGDSKLTLNLYQCTMINGVIRVPPYDSPAVIKTNMYLPGVTDPDEQEDRVTC